MNNIKLAAVLFVASLVGAQIVPGDGVGAPCTGAKDPCGGDKSLCCGI